MATNILETIDQLKSELDALRPLPPEAIGRVNQKLRLEWNYHSNAVEGNSLTLGETRSLILHGITARGKPMRDHLDIQGHDDAVKAIEDAVKDDEALNEVFIRNLHRVLLREPYQMDARTPDGRAVRRLISIGSYKTVPNNVLTSTGEIHYFTAPELVKPEMTDLLDWYHEGERKGEHPIVLAAVLHYRFVRIHPFDDGNGRMARLLMNLVLIRHGYTVAMIRSEDRDRYIDVLERTQRNQRLSEIEDLSEFIELVASCCEGSLRLHLRAARGESIDEPDDILREIDLFKKSLGELPSEQIRARDHIDGLVRPFVAHCMTAVGELSGLFFRVSTEVDSLQVDCLDVGVVEVGALKSRVDAKEVPEHAARVVLHVVLLLEGYRMKADKSIWLVVKHQATPDRRTWNFSYDAGSHKSFESDDLEHVENTFNQLIRDVVDTLQQA